MEKRKHLLSAGDIAAYLNVSEHTIYRWCKAGRIPHYDLKSTYRFDVEEFQKWLESRHKRPGSKGGEEDADSEKGEALPA